MNIRAGALSITRDRRGRTDDPDGRLGITVAGYTAHGSKIVHDVVTGVSGSLASEPGSWSMFHHDPQLTGSALGD